MKAALLPLAIFLWAQSPQVGVTRTTIIDNATVGVSRIRLVQGASYNLRADTAPLLIVSLPRGDAQLLRPGMMRRLTNADAADVNLIAVTIKPARAPALSVPPTEAPPGISRTTVLETHEVRVARVTFAPKGREPLHTHPNDLLTIQVSSGRLEIVNGTAKSTAIREPGFVQFVPRNVPHAYASTDTKPFEILSVTIK